MNPLVVDKISKKFLWDKDSGFLYVKQLIKSLPIDWRFTVLVPRGFERNFFDNVHVIDCIEYDYSTSIHQNRYHFNRNLITKIFPYSKDVDVIINSQPEVSANLRVLFQNQRRENPLIINLFHWIDCKESSEYATELSGFIWRQVEGFNVADLNLFHSDHAISLFHESLNENHLPIKTNIETNHFRPQATDYGSVAIDLPNKKIILFNHRLNNTTGWKEIVDVCNKLDRDDFVLWFTDDQNLKEKQYLESFDFVHVQRLSFESYGYLIRNSHFSICNIKGYVTWNMAVLDSIHNGCLALVPKHAIYSEIGGLETDDFKKSIISLLDSNKLKPEEKHFDDFDYKNWIEMAIQSKIKHKYPKKYDDVKNYINQGTEKRSFVNKFWNFHANSNFQCIRWKLLSDGFTDDIDSELTIYSKPNLTELPIVATSL